MICLNIYKLAQAAQIPVETDRQSHSDQLAKMQATINGLVAKVGGIAPPTLPAEATAAPVTATPANPTASASTVTAPGSSITASALTQPLPLFKDISAEEDNPLQLELGLDADMSQPGKNKATDTSESLASKKAKYGASNSIYKQRAATPNVVATQSSFCAAVDEEGDAN